MQDDDYASVRRTALYINHDLRFLETIIGKHAAYLVDYAFSRARRNDGLTEQQKVYNMANKWKVVLMEGDEVQTSVDCRFRGLIESMVDRFTLRAMRAAAGNYVPTDEQEENAIRVFKYLSSRGARMYEQTRRQLEQYVQSFYQLSVILRNNGEEGAKNMASTCIWRGLQLGAFLDSVT